MPDAGLQFTFTTRAELEGARQLADALERQIGQAKALGKDYSDLQRQLDQVNGTIKDAGKSFDEAAGPADKLAESKKSIIAAAKGLRGELPIVGGLVRSLATPWTAITVAISAATRAVMGYIRAVNELAAAQAAEEAMGAITRAANEMALSLARAKDRAESSLTGIRKSSEDASKWAEETLQRLRKVADLQEQIATAQDEAARARGAAGPAVAAAAVDRDIARRATAREQEIAVQVQAAQRAASAEAAARAGAPTGEAIEAARQKAKADAEIAESVQKTAAERLKKVEETLAEPLPPDAAFRGMGSAGQAVRQSIETERQQLEGERSQLLTNIQRTQRQAREAQERADALAKQRADADAEARRQAGIREAAGQRVEQLRAEQATLQPLETRLGAARRGAIDAAANQAEMDRLKSELTAKNREAEQQARALQRATRLVLEQGVDKSSSELGDVMVKTLQQTRAEIQILKQRLRDLEQGGQNAYLP